MERRRGFSLIEVIVALSLLGLLLGGILLVYTIGNRYLQQAATAAGVQQQSMVALSLLERELYNAPQISVNWQAGAFPTNYVWFLSAEGVSAPSGGYRFQNGKLLFQKWVCYYLDTTPGYSPDFRLRRCEVALNSPTEDLKLPPPADPLFSIPNLPAFLSISSSTVVCNCVAPSVGAFQVTQPPDSTNVYDVSLTTQDQTPVSMTSDKNKVVSLTLTSRVFPRNN